jgi:hypothetical protein
MSPLLMKAEASPEANMAVTKLWGTSAKHFGTSMNI